jgi:hypothetical protein
MFLWRIFSESCTHSHGTHEKRSLVMVRILVRQGTWAAWHLAGSAYHEQRAQSSVADCDDHSEAGPPNQHDLSLSVMEEETEEGKLFIKPTEDSRKEENY